jgi:hypothetical protein
MPAVVAKAQTKEAWALGIPPALTKYRQFKRFPLLPE